MTIVEQEALRQAAVKVLVEGYEMLGGVVTRSTTYGRTTRRRTLRGSRSSREPATAYQISRLRQAERPKYSGGRLAMVDLFSGCGGLTLGAEEAIGALGFRPVSEFASTTTKTHSPSSTRTSPRRALMQTLSRACWTES